MLLLTSCFKKNEAVNIARPSILQYIAQTSSLSLLNAAIQRVRLDTAMASGGPFTFFAPSDSAFQAAGITLDSINRMDAGKLLRILEYEVVNGRVSSTDVPGFLKQQFTGLHPLYSPFISKNYYGIFINGITVTHGNIEMGDGVVQVTGRVAFPPAGSQLAMLDQSTDMKFFAALVRHVYSLYLLMANPDPNSYYSGLSLWQSQTSFFGNTMLVPTDSAFKAYGYADSASLYSDSVKVVQGGWDLMDNTNIQMSLIEPYLYTGFNFTSDYKGSGGLGAYMTNVYYNNHQIILTTSLDGMSITGAGIALNNPVKITGPDIIATNGVIQKINEVFLPH
jgi:uncharacterized surface protein with fasciclin (FAS1) repeats